MNAASFPLPLPFAERRRRDNVPMMPLSLCSALYMKPTCRPVYAKRPLSLVHNIFDRLFRVLLLTAATPLLFTSSLLLLPLPLLLLLLAHFVSKSPSATSSSQALGSRASCFMPAERAITSHIYLSYHKPPGPRLPSACHATSHSP
jgi:hypothetical protein